MAGIRFLARYKFRSFLILSIFRIPFILKFASSDSAYPFITLDQDPEILPLDEHDAKSLERLLPEIPLWVKSPDYDRVCVLSLLLSDVH